MKTTNIMLRIKFYIQKVYLCPSKHFFRIHFQSSLEKYPPDQNPSIIRFSGVFILYPAEHPIFSFWSYSINTAMCVSVCVPDLLFLHCALFKNCICFHEPWCRRHQGSSRSRNYVCQSGCLAKLSHVNCDWSTQKKQVVQSLVQDGATSVICVWHCTMQQRRQQGWQV